MLAAVFCSLPVFTPLRAAPASSHAPNRVLVKNVAWEASESSLFNLFTRFGDVETVELAKAKRRSHGHPHLGWAYVSFSNAEAASRAAHASVSLYSRHLKVRLTDDRLKHLARATLECRDADECIDQRLGLPEEHSKPESLDLPEKHSEPDPRPELLQRLASSSDSEEIEQCIDSLGALTGPAEYAVVKAAWKRMQNSQKQRRVAVVTGIKPKHYLAAGFDI